MKQKRKNRTWAFLVRLVSTALVGIVMTMGLFLILPVAQMISDKMKSDSTIRTVDVAQLEPPPPPPEEEKKEEEPEEEPPPPPDLDEPPPPMSLDALDVALRGGDGFGVPGISMKLDMNKFVKTKDEGMDKIFSMSELDQGPRVVFQSPPQYPFDLQRKKIEGKVFVLFIVDESGRVKDPKVQRSDHPDFNKPALDAIKRWKFEPGMRSGKKVASKMKVPIRFSLN